MRHASEPTWLIDDLAAAVESYTELTCVVHPQWGRASDHASFDAEGFAAACLIAYDWQTNPFYHTAMDSVDQLNFIDYNLGTCVTQAVVGYLTTVAMLAPARVYPDFNGDGDVDIDDCVLLIEHWKSSHSQFDIAPPPNGDGIVNDQDLSALLHYWFSDRSSWWDFGLIVHWTLDETEGHIAYDNFGENHAELFGNPIWQPRDGILNGAMLLDGLDDFVGTEYIFDPAKGSLSAFVWVKGGIPGQVVLSQLWGLNWLMADATGGYLRTELREPSHTAESLVSEVTITDGNWHRVGVTWDGMNRVLYVDDVKVAADTQTGLARSVEGLNIGCGPDMMPGTFWSGLIDDVRIYNRAVNP